MMMMIRNIVHHLILNNTASLRCKDNTTVAALGDRLVTWSRSCHVSGNGTAQCYGL
jgi:hypothetical protein